MHRKCFVQHLVWAGMQDMVIITITTISSFALGSHRFPPLTLTPPPPESGGRQNSSASS